MALSRFMAFVISAVTFILSAVAPAHAQWHSLSQNQRNSAIVNRALNQNGVYTGMQCKEWVQNVVYGASSGSVWLPQNQPIMYEWYGSPDVTPLSYCGAVYSAGTGAVIQMKWNNIPHTAIVFSTTNTGMWWVDCNWNRDCRVTTHFVSYSQFANAVANYYTVYYVR